MKRLSLLPLAVLLVGQPCLGAWQYATVEGADGVPLNMVSAGDPAAPAILLIHGIGQSHYSFVRQLDSDLARDFYLVTFDLRGHGESGKPWQAEAYTDARKWAADVDAVLDASGARRPVVVAWSYGTLVLIDYLRVFGGRALAGINLTGALGGVVPFRAPPADDPGMARFAEIRRLQMSNDFGERQRAAEQMVDLLTATPIPAPYREIFMSVGFMQPLHVRRAMLARASDNQDLLPQLVELPVLVSAGSEDNVFLTEDGKALAEAHASVTFSGYAGAGHSVFFEQPERFNAELRAFARRSQGAAAAAEGASRDEATRVSP